MTINKQAFTLALLPPQPEPGEQVFQVAVFGTYSFSFTVPPLVYLISAVVVGQGTDSGTQHETKIARGGTTLLSSTQSLGGGVGGGNGGANGAPGGRGGAGGYSGNGGRGAKYSPAERTGQPGAGGGGGGGGWKDGGYSGRGGPVGLLGIGANGAGGYGDFGGDGGTGSPPVSGFPAGSSSISGADGGNLRWKNDIAVTPGETLTITVPSTSAASSLGNHGAARIMWGGGRSYPSDAADAIPTGQRVITGSNTTFVVPLGVTTMHACAQQANGASTAVTLVVSGATVLKAQNGARIGDGGGDGGTATGGGYGGGGAGGYSGNGGTSQTSGAGGGGAGGANSYQVENPPGAVFGGSAPKPPTYTYYPPTDGGSVGISGAGPSGSPGGRKNGSPDPVEGNMGGGLASYADGRQNGGALAYKNSITVTPGQTLTVNAAGGRIRLIWGPGRSYPNNARNV